jgi:PBSX family phage terminase large subunit
VAEGGKRGAKNVLNTLAFCICIEEHKDKMFLVAGYSSATAKLNVLECDGYGMLNYFEGRCREGKFKDRDCLYVKTKNGEKIILISGGGKDGDEKAIKGNTYGMAYVTEANECHSKFIKEVFDRTLSSSDRKVFHDLNPKEPGDKYYTDVIDFHEKQQMKDLSYGYNYGHFTLADNMSLSDDKIRGLLKTYQKGTVWYERDIKGLRTVAEGIIFRYFAESPGKYSFDDSKLIKGSKGKFNIGREFSLKTIGVDFGGNGSATTFVCTGFWEYRNLWTLEESGLPITKDIDSDNICKAFIKFYKYCIEKYGYIDWVFCDSASTTMINSLRSAARKAGLPEDVIVGVNKNEVNLRPRTIDLLLTTGRLKINKKCVNVTNALRKLKWDEKKPDIPEDKNLENINDWYDAFCYSWLTYTKYIELDY